MRNIVITTDSGCDLPIEVCEAKNIIPFKMVYLIDGEEFRATMSEKDAIDFFNKMRKGAVARTSMMNESDFREFWGGIATHDNTVIHIALGSGISGTAANAKRTAAEMMEEDSELDIRAIDSTLASCSYGILCVKAAEMRDSGASADEIVKTLEEMKPHVNAFFTTEDLTYLCRGGRVSKAGMVIAHALKIMPIMHLNALGELKILEKSRGAKNTFNRIADLIAEKCVDAEHQTLYVLDCDNRQEAKQVADIINSKCHFANTELYFIGATIGAHAGPGLLTIFFVGKERE